MPIAILNVVDETRGTLVVNIDRRLDLCPLCHHAIELSAEFSASLNKMNRSLQLVYRCPRHACLLVFIAYYRINPSNGTYEFRNSAPTYYKTKHFSDIIRKTSPQFCDIYNESFAAESQGYLKICGIGYRKSLEFLLKDYLIDLHPDKADEIKSTFLGKCIQDYVSNSNVKAVAKRAVWLGNDEAHYVKIWEGKDLQDLKNLVDLTVHWIEMEQLTALAIQEMPEK